MSTMQRLTLIGLNEYTNGHVWDEFDLGFDDDMTQAIINMIMLEHGEKCVLYTDPTFMTHAIGLWCYKWYTDIERMIDSIYADYNPIYNFDRNEEYKDSEGIKLISTTNAGHKAKDTPKYDVITETNINAVNEHQVSADNSSDYQPDYKDISNGGKTTVKTDGATQDLSETSNSKTNDQTTRNLSHNAHLYGNIGVTTTQQMIESEVDMRMRHNIADIIGRLFARELLIGIY